MMNNILVIDDDKELCSIIQKYMDRVGYSAYFCHTGASGIHNVEENEYQLIILDIMLPEIDGFSVLSEIRNFSTVPVLMLTAKNEEADKIRGLKAGADDYLTKPFSMDELMARVESLIRRYTKFNNSDITRLKSITLNGMFIDGDNRMVTIAGNQAELTGKEFDLLYFLASHKGRVFTKQQIYNRVWENEYAFDDSNIMSFISKLRKKIESDADNPFYIQTVRGVGYRFNQEA
jgi:Response regulators consisting of a CheY-like receiver domain and a winged-helix DNA-binding domain